MRSNIFKIATVFFCLCIPFSGISFAQNIAINTDGTTGETGVMLDVKGTNAKATNTTQNVFQVKSNDASGSELKLRLILGNNATAGSRYGAISVEDYAGPSYRSLSLQPSGGNVGVGTTSPSTALHVVSSSLSNRGITNEYISSDNSGSLMFFQKSRGAPGAYTPVLSGDLIATIFFYANDATATSASYQPGGYIRMKADENWSGTAHGSHLEFWTTAKTTTGTTERMRIDDAGNVGIGTTNPLRKLNLYGTQSVVRLENTGGGAWAGVEALTNGGTYNGYFGFKDPDGRFFVDADASSLSDDLVIATNGNVGISNILPAAALDIMSTGIEKLYIHHYSNDALSNNIRFRKSRGNQTVPLVVQNNDGIAGLAFQGYDGSTFQNAAVIQGYIDGSPGANDMPGRIEFLTTPDNSATPQIRMVIDNSGNIGINKSPPAAKLDISQTSLGVNALNVTYNNTQNAAQAVALFTMSQPSNVPVLYLQTSTGGNPTDTHGLRIVNTAGGYGIKIDNGAGASVFLVDASGNTGIGTSAPKSKLHVVGLPQYANNAAAIAGGLTAGAFYRDGGDPDHVCVVH